MGTKAFLSILLCIGLIHICTSYPSRTDSSEDSDEDFSQVQQQQNADTDSLEEFTQKISAKGGRKPPKLQMREPEPEPHDPCLERKREGPCKAYVPRYFFNQASGSCERFGWGGCGKNGNNFKELTECETSCSKHLTTAKLDVRERADEPKNVVETCEKPSLSQGVQCMAYIPRWTYDSSEQTCVQFVWGGCGKTENNFATESLCKATCGDYPKLKGLSETDATTSRIPTTTEAIIELGGHQPQQNRSTCDLPSDAGICMAIFEKYYFNKLNNRCELFVYGGCGGNKNRFDTAEDCVRVCGGDSPANDLKCSDVECPWALYEHYASLGCSPIYDGEACCPTRYECPDQNQALQNNTLESRSLTLDRDNETSTVAPEVTMPRKCRYRGKEYSVGEKVDEASDTGSCRAGCICSESHSNLGPSIVCAQIECPEHLGGRPRGKEHCIPLYKKGSCCSFDYYCPEGELTVIEANHPSDGKGALAKCQVDGQAYYEGQRVYPNKSPCSKCLCQKNPANATSLEGQLYCEKVDCGIEIYYSHNLARGCAPVYYEKEDGTTSCCPISWECPEDKQQEEGADSLDETTTPESSVPEPPKPPSTDGPLPVSPSPPTAPQPEPEKPKKPTGPLVRSQEVCLMEKVEGRCKGHRPRFFFNTTTNKCESFVYSGCEGNLNNFASLEDCKHLCEDMPVSPSSPAKGASKTAGDSELLGRSRRIDTSPTISQQAQNSISLTEVDPCTLPKRVGRCKGYFPRFYYSPEDNECKLFIFGGCHANGNNFYAKDSCEATCLNSIQVENLRTSVPAERANPSPVSLRRFNSEGGDSSRVNFGEDNRNDVVSRRQQPLIPNQSSSEEQDSSCRLPPRTGRCKAFVRRFYYDTDKKYCKSFTYGGCSGNANNFQSLEQCDQKCMPKRNLELHQTQPEPRSRLSWRNGTPDGGHGGNWELAEGSSGARNSSLPPSAGLAAKCKLPKSAGSCHNAIRSYYYDAETKSCKLFFYSGCFGNANRFNSREDCENLCKKPLESEQGSVPATNGTANQPNQPRVHELGESDSSSGGRHTTNEPESPRKAFCKLDPAPGDCKASQLRFYYDSAAESCVPFVYSGCRGNRNNFVTEGDCMSSCGKKPTLEQLSDDMVLSCTFGNKTLPLGSRVGGADGNEYTGEEPPCGVPVCQCITPPSVTCVQRICPPPTTTTKPPKLCATPTCLHYCRQAIGQDGCPTCDCDESEEDSHTVIIKQGPSKSVKG